jgi:hypothetical protein
LPSLVAALMKQFRSLEMSDRGEEVPASERLFYQ